LMKLQYDIKRINLLKDIAHRLREGESLDVVQQDLQSHFEDVSDIDFLFTVQELINEEAITIEDAQMIFSLYPQLSGDALDTMNLPHIDHPGHPIQIFKKENDTIHFIIDRMGSLLRWLEEDSQNLQQTDVVKELKQLTFQLGAFHKHFHRKEKLFFPIMERYGYYNPIRMSWRADDRIRAVYQGVKRQISRLPNIDFKQVQITFNRFEKEFKEMLFQEEAIIIPGLLSILNEDDWLTIAKESDAFGYVTTESREEWETSSLCEEFIEAIEDKLETEDTSHVIPMSKSKNIPFGGGYLTIEEANLILNNIPLEITFVDKNSVFKYFNNITEASEMMFVRTPISIGRNVANCHPPKSLKKVMKLMRDLKHGKRESESMWFKKKDQYVHITYKAIFNDEGEYLGVLEYVQDIQPFFNLPSEVKRVLKRIDD